MSEQPNVQVSLPQCLQDNLKPAATLDQALERLDLELDDLDSPFYTEEGQPISAFDGFRF